MYGFNFCEISMVLFESLREILKPNTAQHAFHDELNFMNYDILVWYDKFKRVSGHEQHICIIELCNMVFANISLAYFLIVFQE